MKRNKQKLLKLIATMLSVLFLIPTASVTALDTTIESKELLLQNALQQYFDSRCILDAVQMIRGCLSVN